MNNNYPIEVKQTLEKMIDEMASIAWVYSTKPGHCFMRSGKLGFATTLRFILAMESNTIDKELESYFGIDNDNLPTQSAFNQQRSLIKVEAFYDLFKQFTSFYHTPSYSDGYTILAVDGSHVVYPTNPDYVDDYVKPRKEGDKGYNQLHLNALYDIHSKCYVDAVIQPGVKQDERAALHAMIDSYETNDPLHTIITVDRGYESFDLIGHLNDKNLRYVMRVKDIKTEKALLSSFMNEFPESDEFDITIKRFVTRSRSLTTQNLNPNVYLYIKPQKKFRSLPPEADSLYFISFRVVRVKLSDGSYECLVTNLPRQEFSSNRLKEIYHERWEIETSFRYLKYAMGLASFHAKKIEYIKQEVFAKLILFNFTSFITSKATTTKSNRRPKAHHYKINFSHAADICHKFLKGSSTHPGHCVIRAIERHLSIDKKGERHFPRNLRAIGAVSFFYRIA